MEYCRHFVQLKTKTNTVVLHNLKLLFLAFVLNLGTTQNMRNQSVVVLWHYTIIIVTPEFKTDFSQKKKFLFVFLMVFNVIDSSDIVLSSKQRKYITLEYRFILIPLYILLSFPAFFNLSFEPKSMHFVFIQQGEYLIFCLQTIHINWRSPYKLMLNCMKIFMLECQTGIVCI